MIFAVFTYGQIWDWRCVVWIGGLDFGRQAADAVISNNQGVAVAILCQLPVVWQDYFCFIVDVPFCDRKFAQLVEIRIIEIHFNSFHGF